MLVKFVVEGVPVSVGAFELRFAVKVPAVDGVAIRAAPLSQPRYRIRDTGASRANIVAHQGIAGRVGEVAGLIWNKGSGPGHENGSACIFDKKETISLDREIGWRGRASQIAIFGDIVSDRGGNTIGGVVPETPA